MYKGLQQRLFYFVFSHISWWYKTVNTGLHIKLSCLLCMCLLFLIHPLKNELQAQFILGKKCPFCKFNNTVSENWLLDC